MHALSLVHYLPHPMSQHEQHVLLHPSGAHMRVFNPQWACPRLAVCHRKMLEEVLLRHQSLVYRKSLALLQTCAVVLRC